MQGFGVHEKLSAGCLFALIINFYQSLASICCGWGSEFENFLSLASGCYCITSCCGISTITRKLITKHSVFGSVTKNASHVKWLAFYGTIHKNFLG